MRIVALLDGTKKIGKFRELFRSLVVRTIIPRIVQSLTDCFHLDDHRKYIINARPEPEDQDTYNKAKAKAQELIDVENHSPLPQRCGLTLQR